MRVPVRCQKSSGFLCLGIAHTIVDKLIVCNGLTSAHGHAQVGRAKRKADQTEEGSDAGEIC